MFNHRNQEPDYSGVRECYRQVRRILAGSDSFEFRNSQVSQYVEGLVSQPFYFDFKIKVERLVANIRSKESSLCEV